MHDIRWVRDHPAEFDRGLSRRGLPPRAEEVLALDRAWRAVETSAQEAQARRNRISREIGAAKQRGEEIDAFAATDRRRQRRPRLLPPPRRRGCERKSTTSLAGLPNLPADEVPDGPDETANLLLRREGEPPRFNFAPLPHEAHRRTPRADGFQARRQTLRIAVCRTAARLARLERALGSIHARPAHQ